MSQLIANAFWGLKHGAMVALAFALGLVAMFVIQGPAAFAAYHPSTVDILGIVGIWVLGSLTVGVGRPLIHSSVGQLVLLIVGGAFVAMGVSILVFGLPEVHVITTLLGGALIGFGAFFRLGRSRRTVAQLHSIDGAAHTNLPAKYQSNLTRQKEKTERDWELVMTAWLEANEDPKLGFQFRLTEESSARGLADRLRRAGVDFVVAEPRRFALWRRWMVQGYDSAPAKQVDQVNSWIEKMVSLGAEYGADFSGWSPGRPLPAA